MVGGGTGTEEDDREEVLEDIDDEVVTLEEDIRLIHRDISSASEKLKSYNCSFAKVLSNAKNVWQNLAHNSTI